MEKISPDILKPARYIGKEWNAVHKEWTKDKLKVALCFPDVYEIGMSHLGIKILYGLLNNEQDVLCERIFAPWGDMERRMREGKAGLLSLESRRRLRDFDIIGFSLQYEMNFVDVLNMLVLGGIPFCAAERDEGGPLIIAGGPCAFNPEPMADFMDAFVIGEAEDAVLEIARLVHSSQLTADRDRSRILKDLAKIDGVYVPSLDFVSRQARGFARDRRVTIKKRIVKDLDGSYFPRNPIVPYIQIVHDRISIEIMRGCPHRCKFCQAHRIFNPLRIRSIKTILEIAEESIESTGYGELSLLSLSSGDYPHLEELIVELQKICRPKGVKISLPSLRVRSFDSHGAGTVKKSGLTFAPETGSDRLRKALNKNMTNEEIILKSRQALESGWKRVKLYFMVGLPGETYEDLDAIIKLASEIKRVRLSVSPFIPKPHSGFEREGMDGLETLKYKQSYLEARCRGSSAGRFLDMHFNMPEMSRIEAVLSRGDRKVGNVIRRVWQKGARLQAWGEYFDYRLWMESFGETGIDPQDYLNKKDPKEQLPWSFIGSRPQNRDL